MEVDPDDATIRQAIGRIGAGRPPSPSGAPESAPARSPEPVEHGALPAPGPGPQPTAHTSNLFDGVDGGERGLLLVDANGLRLGGELSSADGTDAGDRVAAQLAGVSREAARATRLLGLGNWHAIAIECPDGHLVLAQSTADAVLLASREPSVPMGRVGLLAERAARAARTWLEAQS
jgi:predicted regulator of Ras-like GTPase activity (Roadblock/LC7/MglB family)